MALNAMGLGFTFTARDMASGAITRLNLKLQALTQTSEELQRRYKKAMTQVKTGAATAAIGIGGLVAIHKASKAYGDFQFTIVSAAGKMKDGARYMRELEQAALEAGKLTQFSPLEAAQGLSELGAQGLSAKQSIQALRPVLDLAAGSLGQLGVAEAATVAMASLNAFGKTVDELPAIVDKLTMVSDRSAFQMRDFQVAIGQAAAQAKAGQQSFDSMLATLGLLRDAGNEASSAATAYREAVRRVAGDPRALKQLKKLGVSSLDEQTGKIKDIARIIAELKPKLDRLNASERNLALVRIFGVRGMKTYNAVIAGYEKRLAAGEANVGDFAAAHSYLVGELERSAGATKKKVSDALDTVGGKYKLLKGSWETLVISIGKLFAQYVAPALTKFINGLNSVIKWLDELSPAWRTVAAGVATFGSALLVLVGTFKVLRGVMGLFTLARLAGRFVAGQEAMGKATDKTTESLKLQSRVYGYSNTKLGKLRRGLAGVGAVLGRVVAFAPAAIGLGMAIGNWLTDALWGTEKAALAADEKWTKFLRTFNAFGRQLRANSRRFAKFNVQLRIHTKELEKAASASAAAAERVLGKTVAKMGVLAEQRRNVMVRLWKAVRTENLKEALRLQKELFEINMKLRAIREARLHIQAQQAERQIRTERDADKRRLLAQRIMLSRGLKLADQARQLTKWADRQRAAIAAIRDEEGRRTAEARFQAQLYDRGLVMYDRMQAYLQRMKKLGLFKGKVGEGVFALQQFQRFFGGVVQPGLERRGIAGLPKALTTYQMKYAARGIVPADYRRDLSTETIRFMTRLRETGALASGYSREGAKREAAFYRWSLEQRKAGRATPWLTARGEEGKEARARAMAEFSRLWEAARQRGGEVTINIYGDRLIESALDVQAKDGARNGGRLRVRRVGAGAAR